MKNIKDKHGILHSSYFYNGNPAHNNEHIQNEHTISSAIYNTALLIVLVVCSLVAAGISKEVTIQIGIAAEAIMLVTILLSISPKKPHHQ